MDDKILYPVCVIILILMSIYIGYMIGRAVQHSRFVDILNEVYTRSTKSDIYFKEEANSAEFIKGYITSIDAIILLMNREKGE